ncbi:MAG TPA: hypothetical protein P5526_31610 [Anaerolineae bacterium]|nr:hypothetical protein [Anaerolineae bacterium]MCB0224163.1 hypothetical protein [Anaerolineae bacterium]HRV96744.1 hypothetical protein [Anaerolineae bacterium]
MAYYTSKCSGQQQIAINNKKERLAAGEVLLDEWQEARAKAKSLGSLKESATQVERSAARSAILRRASSDRQQYMRDVLGL